MLRSRAKQKKLLNELIKPISQQLKYRKPSKEATYHLDNSANPNKRKLKRFYRYNKNDTLHYNRQELIHTNVWPGGFRMKTPVFTLSKRRQYQQSVLPSCTPYTSTVNEVPAISPKSKRLKRKSDSMDIAPWE